MGLCNSRHSLLLISCAYKSTCRSCPLPNISWWLPQRCICHVSISYDFLVTIHICQRLSRSPVPALSTILSCLPLTFWVAVLRFPPHWPRSLFTAFLMPLPNLSSLSSSPDSSSYLSVAGSSKSLRKTRDTSEPQRKTTMTICVLHVQQLCNCVLLSMNCLCIYWERQRDYFWIDSIEYSGIHPICIGHNTQQTTIMICSC